MVQAARSGLTSAVPPAGGLAAGAAVVLIFALLPTDWPEAAIERSGIAALLPVAAPPLGITARAVLALGGGVAVGAIVWAALYLMFGPGGPLARRPKVAGDPPEVRRADAHPDAPPRRPLSAAELPPPPPERPLPADLDVPLAVFDPHAVPAVPRAPVRALKPLAPALAPGERLDTFVLTPPPVAAPARSDEPPSIDALLRRLEQGARRKVATY